MSSVAKAIDGDLYALIDGEWVKLCAIKPNQEIELTPVFETVRSLVLTENKLTKKQTKRLLKYEKNPMARRELQRIISSKEWV